MKIKLLALVLLALIINYASAKRSPKEINTIDELNVKLQKAFDGSKLPGFSVVAANGKQVVFQQSYGFADIAKKIPYDNKTVHNIGSVSKTFIALALMQAVDKGLVELDEDINKYLPFKVNNPYFPNSPITLRHLANHTSGISDDDTYLKSYVFHNPESVDINKFNDETQKFFVEVLKNKLIDESEFLKNVLSVKGKWFSKENFINKAPGKKRMYSNIGATLAAYVIEIVTDTKYEDFIKSNILKPLGMSQTGWSQEDIIKSNYATRYLPGNIIVPDYHLITKADGAIVSNTTDMAHYISEMLNGFNGHGQLLSTQSYNEMFTHKKDDKMIFWSMNKSGNIQHSGADPGILTVLTIAPKRNIGIFMMTNISADEDKKLIKSIKQIIRILKEYHWEKE